MSKVDELKIKNENLFQKNTILLNENRLLAERCNQLLKDKGDLTDMVRALEAVREDFIKDNAKLEQQIEKMKCCGNCAKRGHICVAEEMQGNLCGKNKDKWELRR